MKNKIILTVFALIIFFFPVQNGIFPNEANAIWGKVANMSAKKVAKEVIKDIAQETALNFSINEAQKIADAASWNLLVKDEYTAICLESLQPSGECKKPAQIKTTLTETDKANIGTTAELELEKTLNNGVKFTKWQKFLDFFLPIFSTTLILTGITYAIDPEVKSLFDEIAMNTLLALGLMAPIQPVEKPLPTVVDKTTGEPITDTTNPPELQSKIYTKETINTSGYAKHDGYNVGFKNTVILTQFDHSQNVPTYPVLKYTWGTDYYETLNFKVRSFSNQVSYEGWSSFTGLGGQLKTNEQLTLSGINKSHKIPISYMSGHEYITAIMTRMLFQKTDGNWYTEHLVFTTNGTQYSIGGQVPLSSVSDSFNMTGIDVQNFTSYDVATGSYKRDTNLTTATKQTVYTNADIKGFVPYNPIETDMTPSAKPSRYEKDGTVTLIPPVAIPYTHTDTGETLAPQFDPTTGTTEIVDKDGNIVPEDKVKVGDPVVTTDPQGKPHVQPPATTQNPSPEPIPLTPPTPPNTTPPIETLPPVFPEGESCEVGLKLPKISPLAYAVSESFPFSIPFDLYDGFQAIFSEMGNEKPEFNYKLNFMGEQQEWKISIPDYFDSWKRFTDSFIIFIFDVGIIFMIFRFMGGSK